MMSMPIRLVLADDHPIVLDGLERLFRMDPDFEVVARCRDGEETLRAVRAHRPDVLVLDIRMPGQDGLEVLRVLQKEKLGTRVLLLTAAPEESKLAEALRLGADGVVLKETAPHLFIEAVREIHSGGSWLDKGSVSRIVSKLREKEAAAETASQALTAREHEIVRMVARGLRNRAIADQLLINEGTVKVHLHNIYQKLGVNGRLELVILAQAKGLV